MSKPFAARQAYWNPAEKKECIRLYSKEFTPISELSYIFRCSRDHIEIMLNAEGQLL